MDNNNAGTAEPFVPAIATVGGRRVVLDYDAALLYGVKPEQVRGAVRRSAARFPEDFLAQIDPAEANAGWRGKETRYMALGHRGRKVFFTAKSGRAGLLKELGARGAKKQYTECRAGDFHSGYIVGGEWFTLYVVEPWRGVKSDGSVERLRDAVKALDGLILAVHPALGEVVRAARALVEIPGIVREDA